MGGMARCAIQYLRTPEGDWKPVGVWFATPGTLMSRWLPDAGMADWARYIHSVARPVSRDGIATPEWESWIGYALDGLSNGHDMMISEVKPGLTVDESYAQYVLGMSPSAAKKASLKGIPNVTVRQVPEGAVGPAARA